LLGFQNLTSLFFSIPSKIFLIGTVKLRKKKIASRVVWWQKNIKVARPAIEVAQAAVFIVL
jgi:hypothetical protein